MRLRNLFTPSFRNRLRLFFVVIVVVPMIAVALVLFQIVDAVGGEADRRRSSSEAQRVAQEPVRARARAARTPPGARSCRTRGCATAIADEKPDAIQARLDAAATQVGRAQGAARPGRAGHVRDRRRDGRRARRATRSSTRTASRSGGSSTSVDSAHELRDATSRASPRSASWSIDGDQVRRRVAARARRAPKLPDDGSTSTVDGAASYRVATLGVGGFDGQDLTMRVTPARDVRRPVRRRRWIVIGALARLPGARVRVRGHRLAHAAGRGPAPARGRPSASAAATSP